MKVSSELAKFQDRLGYHFKELSFLIDAVTHSSASSSGKKNNQRLEFLGDRVLGLAIAKALLNSDSEASEGVLAPRFNMLVRKETCAEVAETIELGSVLKLGRSEIISGGRRKVSLVGDAMEAILAAIFLDGGFPAAEKIILSHWKDKIKKVAKDARDPKTELQEWAQSQGYSPPHYTVKARAGPDHDPLFEIEAKIENGFSSTGKAGSKREAEKLAAAALLKNIKEKK